MRKGIKVSKIDIERAPFPFPDGSFDIIIANQVIEHLTYPDSFLANIHRCLKSGGYTIISTENLSAIDNLLALFVGQQAFSQHISERFPNIGNIFSPHHKDMEKDYVSNQLHYIINGYGHKQIFSYFGLKQLVGKYGFEIIKVMGAGFFPLPGFCARLDKIHAHFITIKALKL